MSPRSEHVRARARARCVAHQARGVTRFLRPMVAMSLSFVFISASPSSMFEDAADSELSERLVRRSDSRRPATASTTSLVTILGSALCKKRVERDLRRIDRLDPALIRSGRID